MNGFLQKIEAFCGAACLGMILGIMLVNVVCRYFLSFPLFWAEEANNFLFVWMGYLGFAHVMGDDNHIRVTLIESRLPTVIRRMLRVLGQIVIMFVCFGMAWPTFRTLSQLHKSAAMGLPEKYVYAILPISFVLMGIHSFAWFLRYVGELFGGSGKTGTNTETEAA